MADELLNLRIDQLETGTPTPDDWSIYRDMTAGKTKKFKPQIISDSGNFEWSSSQAALGEYDIGDVVTKGGKWWQSTVNNNISVPGTNEEWTELNKSGANFVFWEAGVFVEDKVFVLFEIDSVIYIFILENATRPYVSDDFTAELAAGDWTLVGRSKTVIVDTTLITDIVTFDFKHVQNRRFRESNQITENKSFVFSNPVDGLSSTIRFSLDDVHVIQLPATVKLSNPYNAEWNSDTKQWTPLAGGEYLLEVLDYTNNQYDITIHGPLT